MSVIRSSPSVTPAEPDPTSQAGRLLAHLRNYPRGVCTAELVEWRPAILRGAAVVHRLKKDGHPIDAHPCDVHDHHGTGIVRYTMTTTEPTQSALF